MALGTGVRKLAVRGLVLALSACLILSACGGTAPRPATSDSTTPATPTPTPTVTPTPTPTATATAQASRPPQPGTHCPGPDVRATTLTFRSADGARLDGALVGSGAAGVLLLSEYPGPYCGWWAYAVALARHGLHVMLFDFHCQGLSTCGHDRLGYLQDTAAAAATLKAQGAHSVALVGASLGGAVALTAAATLHPAALVDLSGEKDLRGIVAGLRLHPLTSARRVHAPSLFAVARGDHYVSVPAMRSIYVATASTDKTLRVLPHAAGHGWDMLTGPAGGYTPLAQEIIRFVKSHA